MSAACRFCQLPRRSEVAQLRSLRSLLHPGSVSRGAQELRCLSLARSATPVLWHMHVSTAQPISSRAVTSAAGLFDRQTCKTDMQPQHRFRSASAAQPETASTSTSEPPGLQLVIYSKDGCHLCDNLKEKLEAVLSRAHFQESALTGASLEVRDITSREDWFRKYEYEIPVLAVVGAEGREHEVPRASPRVTADRLEKHIVANLGGM